jgi:GTP-binding protein
LCVALVDSNIPPQKSDYQLLEWLKRSGRAFQIVATKTDRLSGNKLKQSLMALRKEFGGDVLPYSSKTGAGKDELWKMIRAVQ